MPHDPANFELDDELLSAYLDGELSALDRAAVEARLAGDPAAQQLLHELRSVSQDVQALPQAKLGRNISETIIDRTRFLRGSFDPSAVPESSASSVVRGSRGPAPTAGRRSPTSATPAPPKLPIFGTRRSWIWATLALAAGLLIMVVQRGDDSANKLPPVAQRSPSSTTSTAPEGEPQTATRELKPEAPAFKAPAPDTVALGTTLKDQPQMFTPAKPSAAPAAPNENARPTGNAGSIGIAGKPESMRDKRADASKRDEDRPTARGGSIISGYPVAPLQPSGPAMAARGSLQPSEDAKKNPVAPNDKPRFVVHLVATPAAIQNKTFDQLMDRHNIGFDKSGPIEGRNIVRRQKIEAPTILAKRVVEKEGSGKRLANVELVLVEAPPATILSCLADLQQDTSDFSTVQVKQPPQAKDRATFGSSAPTQFAANNLGRFNRGITSEEKKLGETGKHDYDEFSSRQLAEYGINSSTSSPAGTGAGGATAVPAPAAAAPDFGAIASSAPRDFSAANRSDLSDQKDMRVGRRASGEPSDEKQSTSGQPLGRGREFRASASTDKGTPTDAVSHAERTPTTTTTKSKSEAEPSADCDTWQVLFVLTPAQPAPPSSPPANPPK